MLVLGIETSCDETAAAILLDGRLRSNVVASQAALHARYGGVVPELASRRHLERLWPVVDEALGEAEVPLQEIEGVAVTCGPGLAGALTVGVAAAKTMASAGALPLIGSTIWRDTSTPIFSSIRTCRFPRWRSSSPARIPICW